MSLTSASSIQRLKMYGIDYINLLHKVVRHELSLCDAGVLDIVKPLKVFAAFRFRFFSKI